ncbi:hypothetical protein [Vreelandella sp. EE7]
MHKKPLFMTAAALLIASSTAHADYYNSYGARVESLGSLDKTDSCAMASEITEQILTIHKGGHPAMETLEGDELDASLEEAEANHHLNAIELSIVKAYSYDLDQFSSPEEFKEQFYQDCLEEK